MNLKGLAGLFLLYFTGLSAFANEAETDWARVCYVNWSPQRIILLNVDDEAVRIGEMLNGIVSTLEEVEAAEAAAIRRIEECREAMPDDQQQNCIPIGHADREPLYAISASFVGSIEPYSAICEEQRSFETSINGQTYPAVACSFNGLRSELPMSDDFADQFGENWDDGRFTDYCNTVSYQNGGWGLGWTQSDAGSVTYSVWWEWPGFGRATAFDSGLKACSDVESGPCLSDPGEAFDEMLEAIAIAEHEFEQGNRE